MTVRNLQYLFRPASVALIGASDRAGSIGSVLARNLLQSGFHGPIMLVNQRPQTVKGVPVYPDVAALPVAPELAVISPPPSTVPGLVRDLGARGTKAAVVITAGVAASASDGRNLRQEMLSAAQLVLLRLLG